MTAEPSDKIPFQIGDRVKVVSPTTDRGKIGIIVNVLEPLGDRIYRYRVQFGDGTVSRFFGFELQLSNPDAMIA